MDVVCFFRRLVNTNTAADSFLNLLKSKVGNQLKKAEINLGDCVVTVDRRDFADFAKLLKLDTELGMDMLLDVTAIDWMDKREMRFEMVYHFLNTRTGYRLRAKVWVAESAPEIASLVALWPAANYLERECWDMYGVKFTGHPDLRRILMYDEFEGHPLRKDYPVQGKQPRVRLRAPEVRNTAVDMKRPELVQLTRRKDQSSNVARHS